MVPSDSETQGYILVQSKHKTYDHVQYLLEKKTYESQTWFTWMNKQNELVTSVSFPDGFL